MRRWHEDFIVSKRQWKKHRKDHVESNKNNSGRKIGADPFVVECTCDEQVGRFRKKDAYDCGNTRCYICHSDKFPKRELTRKEEKSKLSFEEQLKDLD